MKAKRFFTVPMLLACALPLGGVSAVAQSAPRVTARCSNRTLLGTYGFTIDGTVVGANILFRGLALQHYDGNGKITQVDHV